MGPRAPPKLQPLLPGVRRGFHWTPEAPARKFSSVQFSPKKGDILRVEVRGKRGFQPHLAPRGSGGSGALSGELGGGGPGPPVWHMVGVEEVPASGASPEAVSMLAAVAPWSTEVSTLKPSSGGAGG